MRASAGKEKSKETLSQSQIKSNKLAIEEGIEKTEINQRIKLESTDDMDREEYFKLFGTLACCRFEQLFSSSKYKEDLSLINSNENEQESQDSASKEN